VDFGHVRELARLVQDTLKEDFLLTFMCRLKVLRLEHLSTFQLDIMARWSLSKRDGLD